ncbi:GtrA family protein [Glaciihabitans sp. dw_435]|uniref:GtrA family protein n=1 Tax=Glaciihabitans sp. dw_435 TaxID=2720081 RepID=UPI001BD2BD8F|nr:GtrA family protein [Glaciihabitans sp. dw_435]
MRSLIPQLIRFGAVGAVGFIVDTAVFNLLRATVFSPENLHSGVIWAKIISTCVAILVNWIGNRYWTFGQERSTKAVREGVEFAAVSLVGLGISLAILWFTHYALGFTSVVADNISNIVGLGVSTVFRFALYRSWVFSPRRTAAAAARAAERRDELALQHGATQFTGEIPTA